MMRHHFCALLAVVGLSLIATPNPALANLINNGDFETPAVTSLPLYQTVLPGSEPVGFGWRITSGNVDITALGAFGVFNNSFDGRQFLDLDGTVPGAIAQSFATTPGRAYVLKFAYANNFGTGGTIPARATVGVFDTNSGSNLIAPLSLTHGSSTIADLNWTPSGAIQFVALGATSTISFTSNDAGGEGGMFLDGVSVDPLPGQISQILPQFAFGGGWYSALYLSNTTGSAVSFPVDFVADDGRPLNIPSVGGSSSTLTVPARGTAVIEAGNSGSLNLGYVSLSLPTGVIGYGIFRQSLPGNPDQEAVVPLSGVSATTNTLIFDDTGFATAIAIVNPSSVATTVGIAAWDGSGNNIATSSLFLAAKSKKALFLRDIPGMSSIVGRRGSVDFTVAFGNVSVLGLRFQLGGTAFTSIPTTEK